MSEFCMRISGICGDCNKYYKGETCPNCENTISGKTLNIIPDIKPHYNRGLGEFVNSRSDYRTFLKDKGMIEVGNERKAVDPAVMRRQKEEAHEKELVKLRPQAYEILSRYEGVPSWN